MGTNFFWLRSADGEPFTAETDQYDPRWHIGKRSVWNWFCWTCDSRCDRWHPCPGGHRRPEPESLFPGAIGVDLGFEPPRTERPTGVHCSAAFDWAQRRADVERRIVVEGPEKILITDGYDLRLTGAAFLQMLDANVPAAFHNEETVDVWFS